VARAFVSVGSNINPAENVRKAIHTLALQTRVVGISTVYCTEPMGRPEQSPYYNCVVEIETEAPPAELKHQVLRRIEADLGRERSEDRYAPRTIDLDLIVYDDLVMKTNDLTLPDPQILHRPFLAIPLHELAPELTLPGSDMRIEEVVAAPPQGNMKPLESYTEHLRRAIRHEPKYREDREPDQRTADRDRRGSRTGRAG
jgi:dihydroneopterin aldolase/2-amino-4-hydroxy-6-hydroxymethyldihydropteridine diphosphokinase